MNPENLYEKKSKNYVFSKFSLKIPAFFSLQNRNKLGIGTKPGTALIETALTGESLSQILLKSGLIITTATVDYCIKPIHFRKLMQKYA